MKVEQLDWVSEASVSVCSMKADDLIHETGNHSCCVKLLLIGSVCRRYFLYYEQIFQCVDRVNNRPVSLRTLELHWSVFRSKCCQSHCLGQFRHQTLNKHVKCKPALIMHKHQTLIYMRWHMSAMLMVCFHERCFMWWYPPFIKMVECVLK